MARRPRLCVPELPHLVLQRAARPAFVDAGSFQTYLDLLRQHAPRRGVQLHGWCLLPQAVWLLLTPADGPGLSALMQTLARLHSRGAAAPDAGALWQGRFRSAVLQPGDTALDALCAVDLAPQLDAAVPPTLDAQTWPWSSLAHHVGRAHSSGLRELPALWQLGNTPYAREAAYAARLQSGRAAALWPQLQTALRGGLALGQPDFVAALQQQLGRSLVPGRRGRPRQQA